MKKIVTLRWENIEQEDVLVSWPIDGYLSQDEKQKVRAYKRTSDRNRFVLGRLLLRLELAAVLNVSLDTIVLRKDAYGKPYIQDHPVHFNLSHSAGRVFLGVSTTAPIGVDIEQIQDISDMNDIVSEYFHPEEKTFLLSFSGVALREAFYKIWCRKEAFSKALGLGLNLPPRDYGVVPRSCASETDLYLTKQAEQRLDKIQDKGIWHFDEWSFIDEEKIYIACAASRDKAPVDQFTEYDQQALKTRLF